MKAYFGARVGVVLSILLLYLHGVQEYLSNALRIRILSVNVLNVLLVSRV